MMSLLRSLRIFWAGRSTKMPHRWRWKAAQQRTQSKIWRRTLRVKRGLSAEFPSVIREWPALYFRTFVFSMFHAEYEPETLDTIFNQDILPNLAMPGMP